MAALLPALTFQASLYFPFFCPLIPSLKTPSMPEPLQLTLEPAVGNPGAL